MEIGVTISHKSDALFASCFVGVWLYAPATELPVITGPFLGHAVEEMVSIYSFHKGNGDGVTHAEAEKTETRVRCRRDGPAML